MCSADYTIVSEDVIPEISKQSATFAFLFRRE